MDDRQMTRAEVQAIMDNVHSQAVSVQVVPRSWGESFGANLAATLATVAGDTLGAQVGWYYTRTRKRWEYRERYVPRAWVVKRKRGWRVYVVGYPVAYVTYPTLEAAKAAVELML